MNEFFPEGSHNKYFPNYQSSPFTVDKFPKVSEICGTYANEVADFTTGNPQGDLPDSDARFSAQSQDKSTTSATKRTRQGEPIQQMSLPTAATASGLHPSVLQQIESNQKRLQNLQLDHENHTSTIGSIESSLTSITGRLTANESAITSLASTQESQGRLIETISNRQGILQNNISTLCRHFGLEVENPSPPSSPNDFDTVMEDAESTSSPTQQNQRNNNRKSTPEAPGGENGEIPP